MSFDKVKYKKAKNKPIKVLIIGNGFDIAHELPTWYADFLDFCKEISEQTWKVRDFTYEALQKMPAVAKIIDDKHFIVYGGFYSEYHHEKKQAVEPYLNKINEFLNENIWFVYFSSLYSNDMLQSEKWIDFEKEISFIIQGLDEFSQNLLATVDDFVNNSTFVQSNNKKSDQFLYAIYSWLGQNSLSSIKLKDFRKTLSDHLEKFIKAFQIYLGIFVESKTIIAKSLDIIEVDPDVVVSFNYTSTHFRKELYNKPKLGSIFVHGDASKKPNNMVLGINEYWTDEKKNTHTNYSIFKKPVQRIQKKTAIEVYDFLRYVEETKQRKEFYFFGHSLDITDEDILKKIFSLENSSIVIFYHVKEAEASYIENVIKLMGHDAFFEKMKKGNIEFRQQQPMISL